MQTGKDYRDVWQIRPNNIYFPFLKVFQRIAPNIKLKAFKDSIRLFMHHFLVEGGTANNLPSNQIDLLKERVKLADQSMNTTILKL